MNITFNKTEILAALTAHVGATGITLRGKEVTLADDADLNIEVSIDDQKAAKSTTSRKPRGPNKTKHAVAATLEALAEVSEEAEEETTAVVEEEAADDADTVADAMEGKAPAKKAPAKRAAVKKAPTKKKRMFGAAKK